MYDENAMEGRETLLIVFFALVIGGICFALLRFASVFFLSVLPVVAVIVFLGVLHYLFWGRRMNRDVSRQDKDFAAWLDELDKGESHEEDEVLHAERTVRTDPADSPGSRIDSHSAKPQ